MHRTSTNVPGKGTNERIGTLLVAKVEVAVEVIVLAVELEIGPVIPVVVAVVVAVVVVIALAAATATSDLTKTYLEDQNDRNFNDLKLLKMPLGLWPGHHWPTRT